MILPLIFGAWLVVGFVITSVGVYLDAGKRDADSGPWFMLAIIWPLYVAGICIIGPFYAWFTWLGARGARRRGGAASAETYRDNAIGGDRCPSCGHREEG